MGLSEPGRRTVVWGLHVEIASQKNAQGIARGVQAAL